VLQHQACACSGRHSRVSGNACLLRCLVSPASGFLRRPTLLRAAPCSKGHPRASCCAVTRTQSNAMSPSVNNAATLSPSLPLSLSPSLRLFLSPSLCGWVCGCACVFVCVVWVLMPVLLIRSRNASGPKLCWGRLCERSRRNESFRRLCGT
jgi:hypothetical protein